MAELQISMSGRENPRSVLIGTCSQCGVCCERILLVEPDPATGQERDASTSTDPNVIAIRKHLVVAYRRDDDIPVWRCTNLRWYDGIASCGIYQNRPKICRDFPLNNQGELPAGCTYRFVDKDRIISTLTPSAGPLIPGVAR